MMKRYHVYILYSRFLDKYYVGSTGDDPVERLRKHNSNHKGFTSKSTDWEIKCIEEFQYKSGSLNREKQIKAWKSRSMIELLDQSIPN